MLFVGVSSLSILESNEAREKLKFLFITILYPKQTNTMGIEEDDDYPSDLGWGTVINPDIILRRIFSWNPPQMRMMMIINNNNK